MFYNKILWSLSIKNNYIIESIKHESISASQPIKFDMQALFVVTHNILNRMNTVIHDAGIVSPLFIAPIVNVYRKSKSNYQWHL